MSEQAQKFHYSNKWQKLAIFLLVFVLVLTVGLGIYNSMTKSKIEKLQTTLKNHEQTIKELKADKSVYVYNLMTLHKNTLEELDKRSQIPKYISHLESLTASYNVSFRGFTLENGKIDTRAVFNTNDTGIAYNKAIRFIWDYRKSEKALFDLEFIQSVESTDVEVKFPVNFTLK